MLIDFKDEQFETKIKNEEVSIVQFSAEWCAPCKALIPVMESYLIPIKTKLVFTMRTLKMVELTLVLLPV